MNDPFDAARRQLFEDLVNDLQLGLDEYYVSQGIASFAQVTQALVELHAYTTKLETFVEHCANYHSLPDCCCPDIEKSHG